MKRLLAALAGLLLCGAALAQAPGGGGNVNASGTVTNGQCAGFTGTGYNVIGVTCGGAGGVTSFNTRTGAVTPASGDYSFTLISGSLALTQLPSEAANTLLGSLTATTPSALGVPSCSTANNFLQWTSGTGFSCAAASGSAVSITAADGSITVSPSPITGTGTITVGLATVPKGGTGDTTFTAGALLLGNTTSALASLADVATGSVLLSGGVATNPAWQAVGAGITTNGGTTLASTDLINAQTGTTYALLTSDAAKLVTTSNTSAVAVSLSQATTTGFGIGYGFDLLDIGAGTATLTPTTSTIDGGATKTFPTGFGCHITSDGTNYQSSLCGSRNPGGLAEKTISFSPGALTGITTAFSHFVKHVKASTVDNMTASAMTFTCATNPTILIAECGTSTTCAAPTTIASVTVTAAGTATPATISSSAIAAGDYTAWEISAGTCTSLDISATSEIHAN